MEVVLVFPHQLWQNHPALKKDLVVFLIEEPRFFSEFSFHKQKLVLHRASLKSFEKSLKKRGFKTCYIEEDLFSVLQEKKVSLLHMAELDDTALSSKIQSLAKKGKIPIKIYPSPGFLTPYKEFAKLFEGKKHFSFQTFYIYQRKTLDILLEKGGKPKGGKWSLDQENRKRLPKAISIPKNLKFPTTQEKKEAISHVKRVYPNNPGSLENFHYPTTHTEAKRALRHFLKYRLSHFGDYEDAIVQKEGVVFHSCLSSSLNIGLLTPVQVIEELQTFCKKHLVPLNSLEGFIRQLIGWREFVRGVYHAIGHKQRKGNFFQHHRKLSSAFYKGNTGIDPIDTTIQKLEKTGYVHHIERLMILGNFFLLCEISPDEVYRWFMELFIDSYDWVMVPNVYGMSQYADGGMMTTKPYFSSSNYILKMSDFSKGSWTGIWDTLFWRFLHKHEKFFFRQPRLRILSQQAKKKKRDKKAQGLIQNFLDEQQISHKKKVKQG